MMLRRRLLPLLVFLALAAVTLPGTNLSAQGRRSQSWNRKGDHGHASYGYGSYNRYRGYSGYRSAYPLTIFGLSFGTTPYGYDYAGYPDPYFLYPYSYDPWMRGSFRAPDLLDDPYFYDRVPSANRYQSPRLIPRQTTRIPTPDSRNGSPYQVAKPFVAPSSSTLIERIQALQEANEKFLLNLARYEGAEAWMEYLGINRMIEYAVDNKTQELNELLARYDGVARDQEFRTVAQIDGFAETQNQLRSFLIQSTGSPNRQ